MAESIINAIYKPIVQTDFMNVLLNYAYNLFPRYAFHMEKKREGNLLKKAAGRMKNLGLSRGFYKWYDIILEKRQSEKKLGK